MGVVITGIGTALPAHQIARDDACRIAAGFSCENPQHQRVLQTLYRMSGIETRGSVVLTRSDGPLNARQDFFRERSEAAPRGPTTAERMRMFAASAAPLAISASAAALEDAGVRPSQVTHLVTATCSGFAAPGFDCALIGALPLCKDVARTQLGFMGCHAALNAIRAAGAFVACDPQAVALVCCAELCSLHYQYGWDVEQVVANSLFADGAAACVVQAEAMPGDGLEAPAASTRRADRSPYRIGGHGSTILPEHGDAMTWGIGDHGFVMTLSTRIPEIITAELEPWLSAWLDRMGHSAAAIGSWAVHPGGPRILQAFCAAMKLPASATAVSRDVLREHGNMSSPTLLFIMERLQRQSAPRPCVMIGFGPGLAIEAALLE